MACAPKGRHPRSRVAAAARFGPCSVTHCHAPPARRKYVELCVCSYSTRQVTPPHPPCQGLAVPRPPDPRLGPLPHHGGHGTSPAHSRPLPLLTTTRVDPSRCTTPLCSYTAPDTAEEAGQGSHSRTVRVRIRIRAMHTDHAIRRALVRAQILRATSTSSPIPPTYYKSLSQSLSQAFADGIYLKDGPPKSDEKVAPPNPLTDPNAMDGMMAGMKTQMVMMVPQMVIMGWINFFFQGFVLSTCLVQFASRPTKPFQSNFRFPLRSASSPCFSAASRPRTWTSAGCLRCLGIFSTSLG